MIGSMTGTVIALSLIAPLQSGEDGASAPASDWVSARLKHVSKERLRDDVEALVGCGTRHFSSLSDDPERGVHVARAYLREQFEDAAARSDGRMTVQEIEFTRSVGRRNLVEGKFVNVIAKIEGSDPERGAWVVGGHYDSINSDRYDGTKDAPGADDDASGTAVAVELARVLAETAPAADIYLCAFDGEELGLFGSRHFAAQLKADGVVVEGMITNDIVGSSTGPDGTRYRHLRCFSSGPPGPEEYGRFESLVAAEAEGRSRQLARFAALLADRYVEDFEIRLNYRSDRFGRGGDHRAFTDLGLPGVRFTEAVENYRHQHQTVRVEDGVQYGDLPEFLDWDYLADVARSNAAVLLNGAFAPLAPSWSGIGGAVRHDVTVAWAAVEDQRVAGYRIWRRATDSSRWSHWTDVAADQDRATLPFVSIDNWQFAVSTVDEEGRESQPRFPTRSLRR